MATAPQNSSPANFNPANYNKVYIATSIDGYIAAADHGLEWLEQTPNPDGSDMGFTDHMDSIDAVVMGRGTFDAVQGFEPWPYDKPVVVVSSTLLAPPAALEGSVQMVSGSPAEVVQTCSTLGFHRLYVDGGRLVTSFLGANLIDEITISTIPVILGDGVRLFGTMSHTRWWDHVSTEPRRRARPEVSVRTQ